MIALKLKAKIPDVALPYLKEHNKLKRIIFNLMKKRGLSHVDAVKHVESCYNYNRYLVDNFFLRDCIGIQTDAMLKSHVALGRKTLIFGSRKAWKLLQAGKITKEEFTKTRDEATILYTGRAISSGNSKFKLDTANSTILFRPKRGVCMPIPFKCSPSRLATLVRIQKLAEDKQTAFSIQMSGRAISILVDEKIIESHTTSFIPGRVAALDAGPNVFGWSVTDFAEETPRQVFKECVSVYDLKKSGNSDKIKYELNVQAKRIAKHAKHLGVEVFGLEKLTMSGDAGKGRAFNKMVNNDWKREHFRKALVKWLSIYRIASQEVAAQYSSTIGCLENPTDTDSVAASLELARRAHIFFQRFVLKNKSFAGVDVIYPPFSKEVIAERWNSKLSLPPGKIGWVSLHQHLKNMKPNPFRLLFSNFDFRSWFCFRPASGLSLVQVHSFRGGVQ